MASERAMVAGFLRFDLAPPGFYRCADGAATCGLRAKEFYVLGLYQAKISQFFECLIDFCDQRPAGHRHLQRCPAGASRVARRFS